MTGDIIMLIINKLFTRETMLNTVWLLLMFISFSVCAEDKTSSPSPVGMAGEVMGSGFVTQSFTGLLVVLISIIAFAWLMKRFGRLQSSTKGTLKIIDGMALSPRERVVLVQVGEEQILLGVAPGRVEKVHVLKQPVVAEDKVETAGNFASRLKEVLVKEQR